MNYLCAFGTALSGFFSAALAVFELRHNPVLSFYTSIRVLEVGSDYTTSSSYQ